MQIIYVNITTLITIHLYKRTIVKLRFNKGFNQHSFALNGHESADSNKYFQLHAIFFVL